MNLTTEIYKENKNEIFTLIYHKVNNIELAEDLTCDVFIKASKSFYDSEQSALSTWLYNIVDSVVKDYWRKAKVRKNVISVNDFVDANGKEYFSKGFAQDVDEYINAKEDRQRIAKAFRSLNVKHRKVAIQYFLRERTYNEIVENLGLPLNTVKGQLFRARQVLQAELAY